ncbi:MAG: TetR/AcrR family transcriptional regulator [Hyphomicrobiaceae bacterium]
MSAVEALAKNGEAPASEAGRRMLGAAASLFARNGYHATSIRDLARELGLTVGALYAHFPSKDRLLAAVYAEGIRRIDAAVEAAVAAERDPWDRLERAAAAHLEMILEPSGYARVLTRVLPSDVPALAQELTVMRDHYEDRFRRLVDNLDLSPATDVRLFRLTLLGALNSAHSWHRPTPKGKPATAAGDIARRIVAMLRTGAQRRPE